MFEEEKSIPLSHPDLSLPGEVSRAGDHYLDLLTAWNKRIDLVAPAERQVWYVRHLLDSYALARLLPPEGDLIDIGSGAGFPGMVIAITHRDMGVYLSEPRGKRAAFLRTVVRELKLTNVTILNKRIEELLADPGFQGRFNHLTSRATFPYEQWLQKGIGLLGQGARDRIWAMLGPTDPPRLGTCEKTHGLEIKQTEAFSLPDGSMRRILALGRLDRTK